MRIKRAKGIRDKIDKRRGKKGFTTFWYVLVPTINKKLIIENIKNAKANFSNTNWLLSNNT